MHFVRNKTRLKEDIYHVMNSLTSRDKISKWTKLSPVEIDDTQMQRIDWTVAYEGDHLIECQFHIMRCAAKAEFCTEVHLVTVVSHDDAKFIDAFSKALLEELRFSYNKTWVIGDNELSADIFRQSI